MFSGIIEEKGRVGNVLKSQNGCELTVRSEIASADVHIGDSVSVNGACLTVVKAAGKNISFDVMAETLRATTLSKLSKGDVVNLERSLKLGDRISGHFVTGHIDCIGTLRSVSRKPNEYEVEIKFPADKKEYMAEKGSIAIDGVSLTIAKIKDNCLKVCLIPLTIKTTNLSLKNAGDPVNIELDILSKYVKRDLPSNEKVSRINDNFLKEHGFA